MHFWQMGKTRGHSKYEIWVNGEHAIDAVIADSKAGEAVSMIAEYREVMSANAEEFSGYRRDAFGRICCEVLRGIVEIRKCNDDKGHKNHGPDVCDPIIGFVVGTEKSFTIYERPEAKALV